jgi:type IV pilus assembly protein PilB
MAGTAKEATNRQRNHLFLSALLNLETKEVESGRAEPELADRPAAHLESAPILPKAPEPAIGAFPAALLAAMTPSHEPDTEPQAPSRSLGQESWAAAQRQEEAQGEPEEEARLVTEPFDSFPAESEVLPGGPEDFGFEGAAPEPGAALLPDSEEHFELSREWSRLDAPEDDHSVEEGSPTSRLEDEAMDGVAPDSVGADAFGLLEVDSHEENRGAAKFEPLADEEPQADEEAPIPARQPLSRSLGWSDEPAQPGAEAPTDAPVEAKKNGRSPFSWLKNLAPKKRLIEKAVEEPTPEAESWTIEDSWSPAQARVGSAAHAEEPEADADPIASALPAPPPLPEMAVEKTRFDWSMVQPAEADDDSAPMEAELSSEAVSSVGAEGDVEPDLVPEAAPKLFEGAPEPLSDQEAGHPDVDWCGFELAEPAADDFGAVQKEEDAPSPSAVEAGVSEPVFAWSGLVTGQIDSSPDEAAGFEPGLDAAAGAGVPVMAEPPDLELAAAPLAPLPLAAPRPDVSTMFAGPDSAPDNLDLSEAKNFRWKRLGTLLVDLGIISNEQLAEALQLQQQEKKPLGQTLVDHGFITQNLLLRTLAAQFDVELWDLESAEPSAMAARMLPEALCREKTMIAVARREDGLVIAMKNPADLETLEEIKRLTGIEAIPALAAVERIEAAIAEIFNPIAQMKAMQERSGLEVANGDDLSFPTTVEPDGSVVEMVDDLLEMAIKMKVSDIHIEPREKMIEVRVRLDGQLIKIKEYSKEIAPMLTARFKILSEVDLVEWRIPQDGRISIKCDGRVVDMRVSILPSLYGQRIVMRLLDKSNALRKLDELGFSAHNLGIFRKLINRPYGLFLVTGPTGSGKTTTLYAALNEIRKPTNNVMTCEDPVEYDIHGINQSQVNEKVGLTFGAQLRAILRQDPDIVLIGEIRDRETAEIAIKAAMTGHMVLSTLHTNDAPGALPRLLDMGVDAANLSTALVGTMGQRLIRRLCRNCATDSAPTQDEVELLENSFGSSDLATIWRPVGCPKCHDQGYKGRMAIHEIMPVSSETAELIQQKAPVERIRETVRFYGYRTMQEDALDRIRDGVTSLDEAKRILSFDDIPRMDDPEAYYKNLQKAS